MRSYLVQFDEALPMVDCFPAAEPAPDQSVGRWARLEVPSASVCADVVDVFWRRLLRRNGGWAVDPETQQLVLSPVRGETRSARTAQGRAVIRAMVHTGGLSRAPVSAAVVCALLDLPPPELAALRAGDDGARAAESLRARFSLTWSWLSLGAALVERGVLTDEEGHWLDTAGVVSRKERP